MQRREQQRRVHEWCFFSQPGSVRQSLHLLFVARFMPEHLFLCILLAARLIALTPSGAARHCRVHSIPVHMDSSEGRCAA
jgi:hypothetical protein